MSAQATRVNQIVSLALGLEVEAGSWRALTRQVNVQDPLVGRLRSIGGAIDVGYLDRRVTHDELRAAIALSNVPLVIISEELEDVIVVLKNDEQIVSAVVVTPRASIVVDIAVSPQNRSKLFIDFPFF